MFVTRKTGTEGDCIVVRDNTMFINVCGMRYETSRDTLERYPDTLLGNEKKRGFHYRKQQNDYFFDRHRESFEAILYFYQSEGKTYTRFFRKVLTNLGLSLTAYASVTSAKYLYIYI